jgi:hypothetical protein
MRILQHHGTITLAPKGHKHNLREIRNVLIAVYESYKSLDIIEMRYFHGAAVVECHVLDVI